MKIIFLKTTFLLCLVVVTFQATYALQAADTPQTHLNVNDERIHDEFDPIQKYLIPDKTSGSILWDQYDTDGSNGLSHGHVGALGAQRDLLDDFVIPIGQSWTIGGISSLNLWNVGDPGLGTDFSLQFLTDNGGTPGSVIATATTVSYSETATGRTFFGRDEFEIEYLFEPIVLPEGTYWIRAHVIGPENCFWLTREDISGSEAWVDYQDHSGLQSTTDQFDSPYDLAFQLLGEAEEDVLPVPLSNWALYLGVLLMIGFVVIRLHRII